MNCFKGKPPAKQVLEKEGISVTECLEHCRGLGYTLVGTVPNKCYCLEEESVRKLEIADRIECSGICQSQHCGNDNFVTVYNLSK